MIDLGSPQRQSPVAMVFLGLRALSQIGIGQLVIAAVFLTTGPLSSVLLPAAILAIVALAAFSAAAWWRFTFQLIDGELVVHRGVLRSDRLSIPIDRIQSVAIDQQLLHRLFGIVRIKVDSAGSSATEFELHAVDRSVAEALEHETVTVARPPTPRSGRDADSTTGSTTVGGELPPPVVEQTVVRHRPRRLIVSALSSHPLAGLAILAPLFALLQGIDDADADHLAGIDVGEPRWWWVPASVAAVLAISIGLNLIRVVLQDWDLTVTLTPTGLRRTAGLLSTTSTAASTTRVQVVTTRSNPIERRIGLADVRLATIGQADLVVDGADTEEVHQLLDIVGLDTAGVAAAPSRRVHPASIWRSTRNTTVLVAAGTVGAWLLVGPWALLLTVLIPVAAIAAWREVHTTRWSITDELTISRRIVSETSTRARLHKANAVVVTESPFERRRGLARVHLQTAAGTVEIGMIPATEAHLVRDRVLHAAETDTRPWM